MYISLYTAVEHKHGADWAFILTCELQHKSNVALQERRELDKSDAIYEMRCAVVKYTSSTSNLVSHLKWQHCEGVSQCPDTPTLGLYSSTIPKSGERSTDSCFQSVKHIL